MKTQTQTLTPQLYDLFDLSPRKGDLKKLQIVKASIECLATLGFDNTTYDAIAQKIGTRRAHIAYHFSDKNDIFLSSIKYIRSTHQQIILENIEKSKSPREMLLAYVESTFVWAIKHPHQLSVMLLLYYLCTYKKDFRKLHNQIRKSGAERIGYILSQNIDLKLTSLKISFLSKSIQNIISGSIIDAVSTENKTLDEAKNDAIKLALYLLKFNSINLNKKSNKGVNYV